MCNSSQSTAGHTSTEKAERAHHISAQNHPEGKHHYFLAHGETHALPGESKLQLAKLSSDLTPFAISTLLHVGGHPPWKLPPVVSSKSAQLA